MTSITVYALHGKRMCFFGNANRTKDSTITFEGNSYRVPAWSVSILLDCYTEVFNTARVNTQTSIMVKKPDEDDEEPDQLQWTWRNDKIERLKSQSLRKKGATFANQLLEQKFVTNDTSDYLWYMTSVDIDQNDAVWGENVTLQVHTSGHIIHAFINRKHVGSQWLLKKPFDDFVFERNVKMKKGRNLISFLSVTVGLPDYGGDFTTIKQGILGPVKLIGTDKLEKDLSSNMWVYKVGLDGEKKRFYNDNTPRKWHLANLPSNKMLVWYKTSFKSPKGEEAVVLDLLGLGKGIAWVNGYNIGRYWPAGNLSSDIGCTSSCDGRSAYTFPKHCGKSSQRWYHVPRSFLRDEGNTLILFEEFGGNPACVNVQTVTVGKVCGNAYEGNTLELSCYGGRHISKIRFASFGDPKGSCESFQKGSCESPNSLAVIQKACVGKESCSIDVSEKMFELSGCGSITKRLAVEAVC